MEKQYTFFLETSDGSCDHKKYYLTKWSDVLAAVDKDCPDMASVIVHEKTHDGLLVTKDSTPIVIFDDYWCDAKTLKNLATFTDHEPPKEFFETVWLPEQQADKAGYMSRDLVWHPKDLT